MKGYKIQMMTKADACVYYGGGNNYSVQTIVVTGEDEKQAVAKAEILNPGMEINPYYVVETEIPADHIEQMTMIDFL